MLSRRVAPSVVTQESAREEKEVAVTAEVKAIVVAQVETKMKGKTAIEVGRVRYLQKDRVLGFLQFTAECYSSHTG